MIYAIWHQDYDNAGYDVVEGPEGADIAALNAEFRAIPWETRHEKWGLKTEEYNKICHSRMIGSHVIELGNWLVAEKGFSRPAVTHVEA
jgi:hypothetical protein